MKLGEFLHDIGRPVGYYPSIAKLLGSVKAALFLCQFLYWEGKQHDPYGWVYKTADDIYDETGLCRKEQETARSQLRQLGVLDEKLSGIPATLHFRVNIDVLEALWGEYKKAA